MVLFAEAVSAGGDEPPLPSGWTVALAVVTLIAVVALIVVWPSW